MPAALRVLAHMVVAARVDRTVGYWSGSGMEAVSDHDLGLHWLGTLTGSSCHFGSGVVACGAGMTEERLWGWRSLVLERVRKWIEGVCYKDPRKVEVVDLGGGLFVDRVFVVLAVREVVALRK